VDFTAITVAPSSIDTSYELVRHYQEYMKAAGFTDTASPFAIDAYLNALIFGEALKRAGPNVSRDSLSSAFGNMSEVDIFGVKVTFSATNHHGIKEGFFVLFYL
jgi:ABC-type branched-subunit amino acid transport system substrate-binding protein